MLSHLKKLPWTPHKILKEETTVKAMQKIKHCPTHLPIRPLPIVKTFPTQASKAQKTTTPSRTTATPLIRNRVNNPISYLPLAQNNLNNSPTIKTPIQSVPQTASIRLLSLSLSPAPFSITLPALSSPELFHRSHWEERPSHSPTTNKKGRRITKSVSPAENENKNPFQVIVTLYFPESETIFDFLLRKALKPLQELKEIQKKKVENLFNFRGAPMVTTFIRSTGSRN